MRATCYQCQDVTDSLFGPRCLRCDFPMIVNAAKSEAQGESAEFARPRRHVPLPGISAKSRRHPSFSERRAQRDKSKAEARRAQRRRRFVEAVAASGLLTAIGASLTVLL